MTISASPPQRRILEKPTISVIVPTYGRAQFLEECLRSIDAQTYPAAEIIVVDDYSPDPVTVPVDLTTPVKVVRHVRNQGPGAARNTGLAHAITDLVMFLDDDDLIVPERLQWVTSLGDRAIHACDAAHLIEGKVTSALGFYFEGDLRDRFMDGSEPAGRQPQVGQLIFRREDLVQFDPTMRQAEDTEWWHRMIHAANFAWTPRVGLLFRQHSGVREHYHPSSRLLNYRVIVTRHGSKSALKRRRAHIRGRAAGAALHAGRPWLTVKWSAHALLLDPRLVHLKRMVLGMLPSRYRRRHL